eukprot:7943173-Pyramimonas_sp.AAC.1
MVLAPMTTNDAENGASMSPGYRQMYWPYLQCFSLNRSRRRVLLAKGRSARGVPPMVCQP